MSSLPARTQIPRHWLIIPGSVAVAWLAGSAIAAGGTRALVALTAGGSAVVGLVLWGLLRRRVQQDFTVIELPALLLLAGELVFRQRDAESLASNPLDLAGLYQVGCGALALLLAGPALTSPISRTAERITTRPFRLYCAYVIVVFIGAPLSVNLPLTAYRGVELGIGIVVLIGAYRRGGQTAIERILSLVYWFTAISAIVIWVEAAILPGSAFAPVRDSPFPIQLRGVLPVVSANGTGTIGAMLFLWSLARLLSRSERGHATASTLAFLAALGFVTLAFAQYRTGYIVTIVGLLVLLALRARAAAFWFIVATIFVATVWGSQITQEAVPVLQRGASVDTVRSLSGRLTYWSNALPVWRESPLFGRGLLTASRYEVLAELGSVYTSSIHGTWVEALVGSGLVGVGFLALSALVAGARALREAVRPDGRVLPAVLLTVLLVRSATGQTFEVAGTGSIIFMAITLLVRDDVRSTDAWEGRSLSRTGS